MTSETFALKNIVEKFKNALPSEFDLNPEDKWKTSNGYVAFDLAIYANNRLYAIVELKTKVYEGVKKRFQSCVKKAGCRFGILTNGELFYLYDSFKEEWHESDFDNVIKHLVFSQTNLKTLQVVDNAIKRLLEERGLGSYADRIEQSTSSRYRWMFNDDAEREFFMEILNKRKTIKEFCRYTSLDSLISMINNMSYQMCGIAGMNDKSETDYFDKKCGNQDFSPVSVRNYNNVYLSSGTSRNDDLTMWRLYGNDGQGVCLVFDVNTSSNFYIANVDYAKDDKSHIQVEFIKEIIEKGLKFNNLNVWKHFFKPNEYSIENEIRLIFEDNNTSLLTNDDKKIWIKTNNSSIIIPVIRFDVLNDSFPLILKTVMLGPRVSEPETNKAQLELLLNQIDKKGMWCKPSIKVECSSIKHYR